MKYFYWFAALFPLVAGCMPKSMDASDVETEIEQPAMTIRLLALGDSYTIGEGISENDRWSNLLSSALKAESYQVEATIIARTGWTTGELWRGIETARPDPPYQLVCLLIGVNNQYRGYEIESYREEFRFLLAQSVRFGQGDPNRVFVLSIPDWSVMPFAADREREVISAEIDSFNAVNRDESEMAGVHYVDITDISRRAAEDPTLLSGDGLHPSARMYVLWVERMLPDMVEVLQQQ